MNKLFRILVPFICLACGIMFAFMAIRNIQARSTYQATTAEITDIQVESDLSDDSTTHHVYIKYTADGSVYETELGTYSASMSVGKSIDIKYDPDDPSKVIDAGIMEPIMLIFISLIGFFAFFASTVKKITGR